TLIYIFDIIRYLHTKRKNKKKKYLHTKEKNKKGKNIPTYSHIKERKATFK
ncbi:hypothetical protein C1646_689263, partial [Rhizophagus diaphanus]